MIPEAIQGIPGPHVRPVLASCSVMLEQFQPRAPLPQIIERAFTVRPTHRQCFGQLRPIGASAALDLHELLDELPLAAVQVVLDDNSLGLEPQSRLSLPIRRDAQIRNQPALCMMAVAELEAGMISAAALVVAKVDRLARSQNFLSRILEAGVEVRFSRPSLRG